MQVELSREQLRRKVNGRETIDSSLAVRDRVCLRGTLSLRLSCRLGMFLIQERAGLFLN